MKPDLAVFFILILNMSITASYCILAVLFLRLVFRKAPRRYLYLLWLLVGFRLVCPVSVGTDFSVFGQESFSMSAPTKGSPRMQYIAEDAYQMEDAKLYSGIETVDTLVNIQLPKAAYVATGHWPMLKNLFLRDGSFRLPLNYLIYFGKYVWVSGAAILFAFMAGSYFNLKRKVRMAVRAEDSDPSVFECDDIPSPFVMGIFHPCIYLPCRLEGEERELVLLHERYHIQRRDHLIKLLAYILVAVYWFHPLVWISWFCMCRDMEMSCDEHVLELLGEEHRKDYSRALLALASEHPKAMRLPLGFGENAVKSRIKYSLSFKKKPGWFLFPALLAVVLLFAFFGTNGRDRERQTVEEDTRTMGEKLYDGRNPYIGDAPADGEVLGVIAEALPGSPINDTAWKTSLQTSEEPYEFCFEFEEPLKTFAWYDGEPEDDLYDMTEVSTLMFALIDNLGQVRVQYKAFEDAIESLPGMAGTSLQPGGMTEAVWTVESVEEAYGIEDLKACGGSPEELEGLLQILRANRAKWEQNMKESLPEDGLDR